MLTKIISVQFFTGILISIFVGIISGSNSLTSSIFGTMSYLIPNIIFAFQLKLGKNILGKSYVMYFFLGEMIKILLILLTIVTLSIFYSSIIIWWAFLIGIISVSQIYLYLFLFVSIKNT